MPNMIMSGANAIANAEFTMNFIRITAVMKDMHMYAAGVHNIIQ